MELRYAWHPSILKYSAVERKVKKLKPTQKRLRGDFMSTSVRRETPTEKTRPIEEAKTAEPMAPGMPAKMAPNLENKPKNIIQHAAHCKHGDGGADEDGAIVAHGHGRAGLVVVRRGLVAWMEVTDGGASLAF